ncbi:MAG: hypothetical protein ROZ09_07770 [Thiobacillus sp.]|uniref:hypothetical protein n=1 Tax=Thiobacillus sp. TaxID=924 RepID=UPI002896018A|nr:hypothetical protein [Thiobacillus sp.]MDT3706713.1 hypothetical protein [Thiobacillus sp.]
MKNYLNIASLGLLFSVASGVCVAEEVSREQIKGIDEQVQDIKKDVLAISTDLTQLEEKLLYPSNTQVSLFVSLAQGEKFRLDAMEIKIDGKDAAHHLYTFKELEALQKGGVQRIYTGNIRSGEHTLDVTLIGKTAGNSDFRHSAHYTFTKDVGPRLVEIKLAGPGASSKDIEFKDR